MARTSQDLEDCWRLAYRAYLRQGLIHPNPFGFHTARKALVTEAAFIIARVDGAATGTATAIIDGSSGLPLDAVFQDELQTLRCARRRLMEIGLVATDRTRVLPEVLRYAIQFGLHTGCTDVVCGMHPRRERLYRQLFAMEPVGGERTYPALRGNPVRLMHGVFDTALGGRAGKARLARSLSKPVAAAVFEQRIRLDQPAWRTGPLAEYIRFVLQPETGSPNDVTQ